MELEDNYYGRTQNERNKVTERDREAGSHCRAPRPATRPQLSSCRRTHWQPIPSRQLAARHPLAVIPSASDQLQNPMLVAAESLPSGTRTRWQVVYTVAGCRVDWEP